ncbi:MAG: hypothetical protein V9G20_30000 [Candidatus Promineifilaceae bacterium]
MSYPNPADIEGAARPMPNLVVDGAGRPEHRLPRLQHHRCRRSTTSRCARRLNMAINKPAIIEALFQGAGQRRQEPDPADHVVVQRRHRRTTSTIPEAAKKVLADAGVTNLTIDLWAMPVSASLQPERPARCRTDPGRLGRGRRHGQHRDLRMDRVPRATASRRTVRGAFQIGWTGDNGDPDNFFATLFSLLGHRRAATTRAGATRTSRTAIQEAKKISDQAERTELYTKAQEIFKAEAPAS